MKATVLALALLAAVPLVADEHAAMNAVLEVQARRLREPAKGYVVVAQQTARETPSLLEDYTARVFGDIAEEIRADFLSRNATAAEVLADMPDGFRVASLAHARRADGYEWFQIDSSVNVIVELSRPGFDLGRSWAVVALHVFARDREPQVTLYRVEKQPGGWKAVGLTTSTVRR